MTVEKLNRVILQEPLTIDGETVTEIELRKPRTGDLRGVKLTDLLQMDVNAVLRLLPKISHPYLTPSALEELDPTDLATLSVVVTTFFAKRRQLEGKALTLPEETAG